MGIFEEAAIFRGVTKEDARQMLNCLNPVEKTYKKDEIIYHAGDEVTSMGVVLSGSVFIENDDIWGKSSHYSQMAYQNTHNSFQSQKYQ